MTAARRLQLPSGRWTGITGLGDPLSRRIVVLCHPMPGAGGFDPDPPLTTDWGIHLIAPDRPGYGASDPWPDGEQPSTATWADEVAAWILESIVEGDEHSAVEYSNQIGVIGWGTGGAYAVELARRLGDRADRLALVGTRSPGRLRADADHDAIDDGLWDDAHPIVDRRLGRMFDAAREQGEAGRDADVAALAVSAWADRLVELSTPVLTVHRGDARGVSHDARWFASRLGSVRSIVTDSALPIVDHWRELLDHVAPDHGHVPEQSR